MTLRPVLICCGLMAAAQVTALAARLPLRHYTMREGLGHDRVVDIVSDSRGFLWFTHPHGVTRFDGHSFVTLGVDRELSRSLVEDPDGSFWAASGGQGVFRIDPDAPDPAALFKRFPVGDHLETNRVHAVLLDRGGRLWAGTRDGLFVRATADEAASFQRVDPGLPSSRGDLRFIWVLLEDRHGSLWIGTAGGL